MNLYNYLSGIKWLRKSYSFKFLFIAFLGIHIPLIGLIVYISFFSETVSAMKVLLITLVLTLVATGITLYFLKDLLSPLAKAKEALRSYLEDRILPELPQQYEDEAGLLLQKIQVSIYSIESFLGSKKDITSLISHEVREPINKIIQHCEVGMDSDDLSTMRHHLKQIAETGQKELDILDQMLTILKSEEIAISKDIREHFKVIELLDEILYDHKPAISAKQINLQLSVSEDVVLYANRMMIAKVISNLLHNAIKFTRNGGHILLRIAERHGKVEIRVEDDGIGFDEEIRASMFHKFSLASRVGTDGEPSTGMGLHLCKRIIDNHNGTIVAKSNGPNEGSSFICYLPTPIGSRRRSAAIQSKEVLMEG